MPKKRNGSATEPTWYVYRLRHTPATFVGVVAAPDAETTIKRAIEELSITDPQQQKRLVARRRL